MIRQIWCMHDKVSDIYEPVTIFRNAQQALKDVERQVYQAMKDQGFDEFMLRDYELVEIGCYDDETGTVTGYDNGEKISFNAVAFSINNYIKRSEQDAESEL